MNKSYCYILRLSLNKTSTVIVWFSVTDLIQTYPDRNTIPQLLPAPDVLLRLWKEKSKYITKHLLYGSKGNSCFVFPRVLMMFPKCGHGLKRHFLKNSLCCENNSMLNAEGNSKFPIVELAGNLNIRKKQGNEKFPMAGGGGGGGRVGDGDIWLDANFHRTWYSLRPSTDRRNETFDTS